ncbi:hypothetical protein GOODEAATRI_023040 [Goodea atripinnis]|uniref:Uncharacterized protein n=1 Tax=Goodea atripinnis TaxID=208336 RepID=A0ABV0NCW8_9TELE
MFHADKLDRKKVKDLQGTLFTPINAASKHANMLPETITNLLMTDTAGKREGKSLFTLILQELTYMKWTDQSVVLRSYHLEIPRDVQFLGRLKSFAVGLSGFPGIEEVPTGGLLVFRCSHNTLVDSERPVQTLNGDLSSGHMLLSARFTGTLRVQSARLYPDPDPRAESQEHEPARVHLAHLVASVTVSLEAIYDMLALCAWKLHTGFSQQITEAMLCEYQSGEFEEGNTLLNSLCPKRVELERPSRRVKFILDFNEDPV